SGLVWVAIDGKIAVVAPAYALLAPAQALLGRIANEGPGDLRVHVSVSSLLARFDRARAVVLDFGRLAQDNANDTKTRFGLRLARPVAALLPAADGLDLVASTSRAGLEVTARLSARDPGAWGEFAVPEAAHVTWGADLLPRDSVLVYTTHLSPGRQTA